MFHTLHCIAIKLFFIFLQRHTIQQFPVIKVKLTLIKYRRLKIQISTFRLTLRQK